MSQQEEWIAEPPNAPAGNGSALTKEQIEAYRQRRLTECGQRLTELLNQYDCDLVAVPQFTEDGRITAIVRLVAK